MKSYAAAVLALILHTTIAACPFCGPDLRFPGAQRQLREYELVVVARCLQSPPDGNAFSEAPALFEILTVIKGGAIERGTRVSLGVTGPMEVDRQVLVFSDSADFAKPVIRRVTPTAIELFQDVAALPTGESDAVRLERLRSFLKWLGNPDRLVSATVLEEFSAAPYSLVRQLAPDLDAERLVALLGSADTPNNQRGLLFLLYGTLGRERAGDQLVAWLKSDAERVKPGLDGLMGAYLLVEGAEGLEALLELAPTGEDLGDLSHRRWYAKSLISALDFHARYEDLIERGLILATLERMLDDPVIAGGGIGALTRLEAWSSLPRVAAAEARWAEERPSVGRAALAFYEACPLPEAKDHQSPDPESGQARTHGISPPSVEPG